MARIRITKRTVDALESTNSRGDRYFDEELQGFGCAAYASGRKTFFVMYGKEKARKLMTIGEYGKLTVEEARKEARKLLGKIELGEDPLGDRQERAKTPLFREWTQTYLKVIETRKKSLRDDRRYLGMADAEFGAKRLDEITMRTVQTVFSKLTANSTTQANRWLASVRAALAEAFRKGFIPENPAMKIRPNRENPPRQRVLSDDEMDRLIESLNLETDPHARAAIRLMVETGCRSSEIKALQWEDIDFERGSLALRSPKAGHPQYFPLAGSTLEFLRSLPQIDRYVIAGRFAGESRYDFKGPWKRAIKRAALTDVTIHDLRRSFGAKVAREAGIHVASKLLRHSDVRVTSRVYAPIALEDLRKTVDDVNPMARVLGFRKPA